MKLQLTHLLFPALLALSVPTHAGPQTSAEFTRSIPEPGVLQLEGSGPGVVIVGRTGPGGEFIGMSRLPFVCNGAGRAQVTLSSEERRPGALVRTQFLGNHHLGLAPALELAAEHVLAGAGDLEILAVTPTSVKLRNTTRFALPLDGATFANESGESVLLPAGSTVPPGAIVRVSFGPSTADADLEAPALAGLGASDLRLSNGEDELVARWTPATAGPSYTTSASQLGGASSWGGTLIAEDLPDAAFLDSNGDGIDGDLRRAIFVDGIGGSPTGDGSLDLPLNSLQAAIDLAAATAGKDHVYVSRGTYSGTGGGAVALADGISIWGGYDAVRGWRRSASFVTRIHAVSSSSDGMVGVRAEILTQPTTLGDLLITTSAGVVSGQHTYGVKAYLASDLHLERVDVAPGAGQQGQNGASIPASSAKSGGNGGNGGGAGTFAGKKGSTGASSCFGNQTGGSGGNGGTSGGNGKTGSAGKTGFTSSPGVPANNFAFVTGSVLVVNGKGTNGTPGECGSGGGGGGGGSGGIFKSGGKGGKGGSSGRGGNGGTAGLGGGSSMALFAQDSHVTLVDGSLTAGNGGQGGNGGARSGGLIGANGSNGSAPSGAGDGGKGGKGGSGGGGGGGPGGGGGSSFGVVLGSGGTLQVNGTLITPGAAGLQGFGNSASNGLPGQAATIIQL